MRISTFWVILLAGTLCFAQKKMAPDRSLIVTKNWTPIAVRIFPQLSDKLQFTLTTSWIPGEKSKGSMRYRLTVQRQAAITSDPTDEGTDWMLRNFSQCAFSVKLYDAGGFLVRSIPIHFDFVVDDSIARQTQLVASLNANSASQLSADEYRLFVHGGNWQPEWEQCALGEVK